MSDKKTPVIAMIQNEVKVPKGQENSFGHYNYRSCEDILEVVKPVLLKHDSYILIYDKIISIDGRYYVQAIATLMTPDGEYTASAYAREPNEKKKGMDESQTTGAASSYARKYALNGLLCIDDTKDADTDELSQPAKKKQPKEAPRPFISSEEAKLKVLKREVWNLAMSIWPEHTKPMVESLLAQNRMNELSKIDFDDMGKLLSILKTMKDIKGGSE